jgi:DNA polymerase I-like protein with 3'-5' exonuclease and polymerase domains
VNFAKGAFGEEEEAFEEYCEAMKNYCERDVLVTHMLFSHLVDKKPSNEMVKIEHNFARIIRQQELCGFGFDEEAALDLAEDLTMRRAEIRDELQKLFPPVIEEMKTASGWSVEHDGETFEGETKTKLKEQLKEAGVKQSLAADAVKTGNKKKSIPFNPGSRDQIAKRLFEKYEWLPEQRTPDGRPKIDEAILKAMKFPEAKVLCEYLMVSKRLGQLAEGKEAWLKVVKDGRIHGKVNTNGAVTGRCTHSGPNLAQVPASRAPYGERCRALFIPHDDFELVGVDASGLELRCLAHYLALWDGGEYGNFIVDGDVHSVNQEAAGLDTRDQAKTFIYAFLYGAGDAKIGNIVGGSAKDGAALKKRFLNQIPALARLKAAVEAKARSAGQLMGIDGRLLPVRSEHAALNTLLQSAGAVAMKTALVLLTKCLTRLGWRHSQEWSYVANVHDEFQAEVKWDKVELYGKLAVDSIYQAGEHLKMKCHLDGEYKVGSSWAETH